MSRIAETFAALQRQGRKALVGFLMAGDPTPAEAERRMRTALATGVDILELGVPFSDPTADGPVIQAAARRALARGTDVAAALACARRLRRDCAAPLVLFGYANPFFVRGYARVCAEAAAAGVDALLVVDLPFEEADELRGQAERCGLDLIPLVAPTTPAERLARWLPGARGFVYYITVRGVTGMRHGLPANLAAQISRLRRHTKLPIVAGFGVRNGAQARAVATAADGVVIGSALIRAAERGRLAAFVRRVRHALDRPPAAVGAGRHSS